MSSCPDIFQQQRRLFQQSTESESAIRQKRETRGQHLSLIHIYASGNQPHTEKSDTAGGCYTGTHGHVHSVEDGCYKEESYHVHRDDCSGYPVWVDWAPGVEPYWGFIYTCGEPANATRRVLICSKQAGSTDYYVPVSYTHLSGHGSIRTARTAA